MTLRLTTAGLKALLPLPAPVLGLCGVVLLLVPGTGAQEAPQDQTIRLDAGVPLHVRTVRTAAMRVGAVVEAVLTDPVYVYDRVVLPKDAQLHGVVSELLPVERGIRTKALLDGDVTPLHDPVVEFQTVRVDGRDLPLHATARIRNSQMVEFVPAKKRSLREQGMAAVHERIGLVREQVLGPGKKDRALQMLFNQLPYHPQRIWAGTGLIADVDSPAELEVKALPETARSGADTLLGGLRVRARLVTALSSDRSHRGDIVRAVVSAPVLDKDQALVVAEGTEMQGTVSEVKPSRSFSRNGTLRFAFQNIKRTGEEEQHLHGTLTGAEAEAAQNITVDAEGRAKSNPDRNRFIAPLLLAVTAAAAHDRDSDGGGGRQFVGSNGFGLVARIAGAASSNPNVATGFGAYGFAKSIYYRFIARGHAVTFPKDTLVEVELAGR